jgi:succinyl-CoA synthetase beta subunit
MVAEAMDIERETYLAILMDREAVSPVLVGSPQGGMDIELVAEKSPEAIFKVCIYHLLSVSYCHLNLS